MSVEDLLRANGIDLPDTRPGSYATTCPVCSRNRKKEHQKLKCLGVKIDARGACWGCNHCGWSGGGYGDRKFIAVYDYVDASGNLLWQKLRNPPGSKQKFTQRRPDGRG